MSFPNNYKLPVLHILGTVLTGLGQMFTEHLPDLFPPDATTWRGSLTTAAPVYFPFPTSSSGESFESGSQPRDSNYANSQVI